MGHSHEFFKWGEPLRYLNALFISLGDNCAIFFKNLALAHARDLALDLALDLARDLAHDHDLDLDLARDLAHDHDLDLDLAHDLAHDLDLARVRANALKLDRDLTRVHDRDFALVRALALACALARDRALILQDAKNISNHDLYKLDFYTKDYEHDFKKFLNNLRKNKADYWAEWFEEMFNNQMLTDNRMNEIFSLEEKDFELTIAETSALLLERQKGTQFFNETRLILLGDKGSGKTSFARRFQKLDADMAGEKESTPGVDFHPVKASAINAKYKGEQDYTINIWDFAGHTVTHAAHKFFLSESAVYVIVLRGRMEKGTSINEWLEHITYYADSSAKSKIKVYILVNKSDEHIPQIDYDPKYDEKFDIAIKERSRIINLKTDNQPKGLLDEFRNEIVEYIVNSPQNKEIPNSILDIKKKIETDLQGISNVAKTKIGKIIEEYIPEAKTDDFKKESILHILHSYGICFYYDKLKDDDDKTLEMNKIVLNPRWITYAIYRLINFIQKMKENNPSRSDGHIYEREYETAFSDLEIAHDLNGMYQFEISKDNYSFISILAQTFGLAYKKDDLLIFPNCLPEHYPNKKMGLGEPNNNDFFVEITTSTERTTTSPITFPKDVIPAFIVKRHKNLAYLEDRACCSRNDVILEWKKKDKVIAKAEVKRIENTKIVVLVKNNTKTSCEFGAELVSDLYKVIQKYKVFQNEQTRPVIKISFTDKNGRNRSCEIDEVLEVDSWIESMVEPTVWEHLKCIVRGIDKRLHIIKFIVRVGDVEAGIEIGLKDN